MSADRCIRLHFDQVVKTIRKSKSAAALVLTGPCRDRARAGVRSRAIGMQGAHLVKAPVLREQLFAWFCQIRGAIKGRLPLKILEAKAIGLRLACIEAAVTRGGRAQDCGHELAVSVPEDLQHQPPETEQEMEGSTEGVALALAEHVAKYHQSSMLGVAYLWVRHGR